MRKGTRGAVCVLSLIRFVHVLPEQLAWPFSINRESLAQKMARKSLGKTLPKSYQKEKDKERRDRRLEKRTVGVGVVLPARSDRGKARGSTWIPDRRKRRKRRRRTCLQGKEHPRLVV